MHMQVVPVFAGGLDFSLPVKKFFYDPLGSGRAFVDTVVSLTGFALVGGPARQVRQDLSRFFAVAWTEDTLMMDVGSPRLQYRTP